jgi:hypothetical protein
MQWFNVVRSSGDIGGPGEFVVEDSEGVEWQVTAVMSTKVPGKVTCLNEVVCMNRRLIHAQIAYGIRKLTCRAFVERHLAKAQERK